LKLHMVWKALRGDHFGRHYVMHKIMRLFSKKSDDFYWNIYTHHYRGEMEMIGKDHTLFLRKNDYYFSADKKLTLANKSIKPLHPNCRLLYETLLQLQPQSVLEVGCGNGVHLHNIKVLAPDIKLFGIDRSVDQIKYLYEMNPELDAEIRQFDAAVPFPEKIFSSSIDVCYSQAVIMHIKTGDNHLKALANMFNAAAKQVVLIENWLHHDFLEDITSLHSQGAITWRNLYLYYRVSEESQKPLAMVCSSVQLDYPVLAEYSILRDSTDAY